MMKVYRTTRSAVALATVFCMLALSFQFPAVARDTTAEEDYHRLEPKGMNTFRTAMTWARTGKNTAVVFAVDRPDNDYSINRLISFRMTSTGKTKTAKTFMQGIEGRFVFADAISFASTATGPPAAKNGLLFLAYYMNAAQNKLIFAVAPFNSKGKRTAAFEIVKTIEAASHQRFANTVIFARAVGDAVGVSLSTVLQPATSSIVDDAEAYFLETDTSGALKRGPKAVKLPGGGKLMKFMSMRPAWKYNRWFVPCHRIDFRQLTSPAAVDTEPTGSALMVYYAKPKANGFAIKLREIENDDQADATGAYAGIQFLPEIDGGSMPPPSKGLRLFYQKRTFREEVTSPEAPMDPLEYTGKYYHRVVKKTGKALKAKKLASPAWVPELKSEPGDFNAHSDEVISEAVATADGRIIIGMTRYQEILRAASPPHEGNQAIAGDHMMFTISLAGLAFVGAIPILGALQLNLCYFNKMMMLGGKGAFLLAGYFGITVFAMAMFAMFIALSS